MLTGFNSRPGRRVRYNISIRIGNLTRDGKGRRRCIRADADIAARKIQVAAVQAPGTGIQEGEVIIDLGSGDDVSSRERMGDGIQQCRTQKGDQRHDQYRAAMMATQATDVALQAFDAVFERFRLHAVFYRKTRVGSK